MNQITVRGFGDDLKEAIRRLARSEGISLNQAVLRLLSRGAGIERAGVSQTNEIGSALDEFIGCWSDEEAEEFRNAVVDFDKLDQDLWR